MPRNFLGNRTDRYGGFQDTSGYDKSRFQYGGYDRGGQDAKSNLISNAAGIDERQGPTINQAPQNETRGLQMGSLANLSSAASGNAPSRAEALGQQMSDRALRSQMSAAGSVRGGPGAQAAAYRAANQGAMTQRADMNQGIQAERAGEMATARGQLATATAGARGQDIGLATDQSKMDLASRQTNDARAMEYEKMRNQVDRDQLQANIEQQKMLAGSQGQANTLNAGANENNANKDWDMFKGIAGAAGGVVKGIGSIFSDPATKTPLMGSLSGLDLGGTQPGTGGGVDIGGKGYMSSGDVQAASTGLASDSGGIPGMVGGGGITGGGGVPGGAGAMPSDMAGKNGVMLSPKEAKVPASLDDAMLEGTEGADPYKRAEEYTKGVAGARRGYAAERAGHPGGMFGAREKTEDEPSWLKPDQFAMHGKTEPPKDYSDQAPGTEDWERYGAQAKKEGDPDWKDGGSTKGEEKPKGKWSDILNGGLDGIQAWASPRVYVRDTTTSDERAKDAPSKKKSDSKYRSSTPDELRQAADQLEGRMREEHESRMAAGPSARRLASGTPETEYTTELTHGAEDAYKRWHQKTSPWDTGEDYDLRGAFADRLERDERPDDVGHLPDTYKKPNHETFSDESTYARYKPELAGSWGPGGKYIEKGPPAWLRRDMETSDPKGKEPAAKPATKDSDDEEIRKFMAGGKDTVKFEKQTDEDRAKADYEKREGEHLQRKSVEAAAKKDEEKRKADEAERPLMDRMASSIVDTVSTRPSDEQRAANEHKYGTKIADARRAAHDFASPKVPQWLRGLTEAGPVAVGYRPEHDSRLRQPTSFVRDQTTSDPKAKTSAGGSDRFSEMPDAEMASAMRSMEPSPYSYKSEFRPPEQAPGEVNVGPMANKMAEDPVARTAIVRDPETHLLSIDKDKGLKVVMGSLASLQDQIDDMNDVPRATRAKKARRDGAPAQP